ncbi:MAG: tRNA 2-selenouridine(34) synthase MnmH [Chitinophagaceae bacterium]
MSIEKVSIEKFLELATTNPILDARSPGEFRHAHFPGAYNLPLFNDEERKVVGTAYNKQGRKQAIKIGLDYFGVKMRKLVEDTEELVHHRSPATVLVHCWRGGMRSEAVAWLLNLYGFKVYMLIGGYKKFRQYVLETFSQPFDFRMLAGFTGSGKTNLLHALARKGQTIIDLEELAHHRGSAFGAIGLPPQPSQEMFENKLALMLRNKFSNFIWLEDESQRIGSVIMPSRLWEQMQCSPVYFLDIPFELRLQQLKKDYGNLEKEKLTEAVTRIQKRLGGLETKLAIQFLKENNVLESFKILLAYYDKCYFKSLDKRKKVNKACNNIVCETVDDDKNVIKLMQALDNEPTKDTQTVLV